MFLLEEHAAEMHLLTRPWWLSSPTFSRERIRYLILTWYRQVWFYFGLISPCKSNRFDWDLVTSIWSGVNSRFGDTLVKSIRFGEISPMLKNTLASFSKVRIHNTLFNERITKKNLLTENHEQQQILLIGCFVASIGNSLRFKTKNK